MRSRLFASCIFVVGCVASWTAFADDQVKDAAIGGAIGGALGGAVGAEVGGKQGAVIGAGAIVTKNIKPYRIAVGVPAREIRDRNCFLP